jgi:hypothetical protein
VLSFPCSILIPFCAKFLGKSHFTAGSELRLGFLHELSGLGGRTSTAAVLCSSSHPNQKSQLPILNPDRMLIIRASKSISLTVQREYIYRCWIGRSGLAGLRQDRTGHGKQ